MVLEVSDDLFFKPVGSRKDADSRAFVLTSEVCCGVVQIRLQAYRTVPFEGSIPVRNHATDLFFNWTPMYIGKCQPRARGHRSSRSFHHRYAEALPLYLRCLPDFSRRRRRLIRIPSR